MPKQDAKLRLFIIECTDPMDLLQGRSEREALEKVCKLIGHEVATFEVRSEREFRTVCKYISSIDEDHDPETVPASATPRAKMKAGMLNDQTTL